MKSLLFLVALTTWASASILPSNDNMIYFEFEKVAQTPADMERQSKIIEMVMPELVKAFPSLMQKATPVKPQRQVEFYYMEPSTKLTPPPRMPKKINEQKFMMESLPTVLQMIAEEHSSAPQPDMSMPLPPPPQQMKHIPAPPKPFLEPPHFYMKQHEEPQRHMMPPPMHHHHQIRQPIMQQEQPMILHHPLMYNMPQQYQQFNPYQYQFIDQQFMAPPPMFKYYPIYDFHPPMMTQFPNFYYNQMHYQPMMGQELYYY